MTHISSRSGRPAPASRAFLAILCAALLIPGEGALFAQAAPPAAPAQAAEAPLTADQLDSLVAPIALYPDDLLAQTLVAATYPLELMQLQQWLAKNKGLKDKALADAVGKQPWDPSIQSMAPLPDVVKRLCDDIQWTTDLGNAFLDQQKDVMNAVQRMRKKAQEKGALKTNEQQKVETKVVETQTVIVVQSANPEVIYVPVYSPTVVYPPPVYPYPPIYYPPPPPPGAAFMTFTAGVMIGAAVWGGSCCGCGWGGSNNTVNVNVNNNYNKNTNVQAGNVQHNSAHRGGAPYSNSATASKYGGSTKGGAAGRQQGAGASASSANRSGGGGGASPSASTSNRGGSAGGASPSASTANRGGSGGGASPSASSSSRGGGGGGGSAGAMSGGSGGYSGSSAKASSSRGSSSMSGGGGSRGGGGGGGGRGGRR
jgi:hypothetical protein